MTARAPLPSEAPFPSELPATWLTDHPGWALRDGALHRSWEFVDFTAAFAFMTEVAAEAERIDHHPDWFNSWNRVDLSLRTHSSGGVTATDLSFAELVASIAGRRGGTPAGGTR